jgi:hypothetical protein
MRRLPQNLEKIGNNAETHSSPEIWLLIDQLYKGNSSSRRAVARKLVSLGKGAVYPVIEALQSDNAPVRATAAWILGQIGDRRVIKALMKAKNDSDPQVQKRAIEALSKTAPIVIMFLKIRRFIFKPLILITNIFHGMMEFVLNVRYAIHEKCALYPLVKRLGDYWEYRDFTKSRDICYSAAWSVEYVVKEIIIAIKIQMDKVLVNFILYRYHLRNKFQRQVCSYLTSLPSLGKEAAINIVKEIVNKTWSNYFLEYRMDMVKNGVKFVTREEAEDIIRNLMKKIKYPHVGGRYHCPCKSGYYGRIYYNKYCGLYEFSAFSTFVKIIFYWANRKSDRKIMYYIDFLRCSEDLYCVFKYEDHDTFTDPYL